jgi:hypothetical protein
MGSRRQERGAARIGRDPNEPEDHNEVCRSARIISEHQVPAELMQSGSAMLYARCLSRALPRLAIMSAPHCGGIVIGEEDRRWARQ